VAEVTNLLQVMGQDQAQLVVEMEEYFKLHLDQMRQITLVVAVAVVLFNLLVHLICEVETVVLV
jgi:hypothetical protein